MAKPRRTWAAKFREAFRGIAWGVAGQSSFLVHGAFAVGVPIVAAWLGCDAIEWAVLVLAIGVVLAAELFNSALETLFRGLDAETRERSWRALDIAAGAVLTVSLFAAAAGLAILGPKLWRWCVG